MRLVHQTRDGRLLLGTYRGLYEWRDGRILPLGRQTGLADDTMISAFLELDDGRWVAGSTSGEDLRVYDGQRWHRIGRTQDLPANVAFFLAQTGGELWVAGMRGVYRLPMAELDRVLADPSHRVAAAMVINSGADRPGGQLDKCCNGAGNSRGLLRDGRLWLPTRDGALLVDTTLPDTTAPAPDVRIERLQAQGRWMVPRRDAPLQVPLGARDLKFDFTVPAFQPLRAPQLRYRLTGYEQGWRELDDPKLLRRYERARAADVQAMAWVTDGLFSLFGLADSRVQLLRNRGLSGFDRSGPLKRWFARQAMGLSL